MRNKGDGGCISHVSVVMIKYQDQGNLQEEEFYLGLQFQTHRSLLWPKDTASGRHGGRSRKPRETEGGNWK